MAYKSLDNILNEESDTNADIRPMLPEPAEETGVTPQPEALEATEAEDAGPPPADERAKGQEAAIVAERRKRQEAEALVAQLRQEAEARNQEPPAPPPSIWEDEAGALGHVKQDAVSIAVQQATFNARLDMSEMMARQTHSDFEEMKAEFVKMMQDNPVLQQQALADPHPWQKAYQIAKNARTMQELGATDIQSLEAKIREQILAEQQAQQPAAPRIPPSLSTTRSVSSRNGPAWSGPPALGDILK
jgi:hypothetical protein